jgi:hypothetical protein
MIFCLLSWIFLSIVLLFGAIFETIGYIVMGIYFLLLGLKTLFCLIYDLMDSLLR